ncbi:MAG: hypothetical protein GXP62_05135, partial [Oligoflexia bacterium]|nr:hypothetical protein [Oligoflexia bacterium]
ATISGGSIRDSTGYGLLASDGADATGGDLTIDSIARTSLSTDDGVGLGADGAVLHTSGNTLTNVSRYGILGTSSSLDLSGDDITGAIFGVLASDSDLVASGLSVTDAWTCGIYAYSPTLAQVTDTTVVGTPGQVLDVDPADWAKEAYDSSGIFLVAPESTVYDTSVTGYSGVGILLAAPSTGTADLARVTLTDQGHFGLYISAVQTTAEDVIVSGTYATTSDLSTLCTDVGTDVGVLVYDAELDWSGGSVSDVEGYGISNIYGTSQIDGASVSATTCGGIMAFQGDARITYSDFSAAIGGTFASSIVSYQGATLYVGGSTFHDSNNEVLDHSTESTVGGVLTRRDFYVWSGSDIQVWYGADATILQNSFEHGINGVQIYSDPSYGYSSATLSDNTFSDYIGQAVYIGAGSSGAITDTTFTNHGAYPLACESGVLDLTRVSVSTGGTTSTRTALYEDDVFVRDLTLNTIGPSVFSSDCTFSADNLTVQDADASAVYLQNGSWELSDLTVSGAGLADSGDGVTAVSTTGSATLYVNGADISGVVSGSGLALQAGTTVTTTIFDTTIADTRDDGLSLINTSGSPGSATLSRVSVTGAGGTGLRSSQVNLSLESLDVSSASDDGVQISGGTSSLSASSSVDNGGYGMLCQDDATISVCDINVSGNASGDFSGCGTVCTGG